MKYTIEGFSQEYACSLRKTKEDGKIIKIECTDLVILRWFVDFYPKMKKMIVNGREYAFLNHGYLEDELPLLEISKRAFCERMKKMAELGVLDYTLLKEGGTFPLYTFGANYINLVDYRANNNEIPQGGDVPTSEGVTSQRNPGVRSDVTPGDVPTSDKNPSINNPSIKDSSIKHTYPEYVDRYHSICTNLPRVIVINDQRKEAIRKFAEQFTFDQFDEICRRANVSNFLIGKTSRAGWKADFEFLLRPKQAVRILEGGYDNAQQTETAPIQNGWDYIEAVARGEIE